MGGCVTETYRNQKCTLWVEPMNKTCLYASNTTKYLGHIITDTLAYEADMRRQRREPYVQANKLANKTS